MNKMKGVVCFSGGADSTTLLYHTLRECEEVHAISVNYGQRHVKELEVAADTIKYLEKHKTIPHKIIDLSGLGSIGGSPLIDSNLSVPTQDEKKQGTTVVPFRNTVLATLAAAYARTVDANIIYIGSTYEDLAEYPDCRPAYFESLQQTLRLGDKVHNLIIKTPFINITKDKIINYGLNIGVQYDKTWTCYEGKDYPCLKCDACRERMRSFKMNNMRDPLVSQDDWAKYILGEI